MWMGSGCYLVKQGWLQPSTAILWVKLTTQVANRKDRLGAGGGCGGGFWAGQRVQDLVTQNNAQFKMDELFLESFICDFWIIVDYR